MTDTIDTWYYGARQNLSTNSTQGCAMATRPISRRRNQLDFGKLEKRNLLANDLLPDIFAWESEDRGYLHDYVVEGDLLRFSTAFANKGEGHLEVFGGDPTGDGSQEVLQRIYDDEGGFRDRLAGEFTYHPAHGHIHFDGYAIYNLREIGPGGAVGDILATGGKISFCLIDITRYDADAGSSNYGSCGTTQGVSAGWSDVYGRGLADQWINISGIDDGDYYLEVITDPEDQLLESDETNNTTIITVTIEDGPGNNGDRLEPNNSFTQAYNMGVVSERREDGLSIHTDQDVDYYQFAAAEDGDFEIHVNFSHELGNLDAFVYDSNFDLVASADSLTDLEDLHFEAQPDAAYFLEIVGVDGATNGYDVEFFGPGDLVTSTIMSTDTPVDIPDGAGSNSAGPTVFSTLEGPDITLTDLNLIFEDLQHTWMADLSIALISPSGTRAHIIRSDYEGSGDGPLGSGDNFSSTILDDQAPTSIADGNAPYSGSFHVNYGDISNPFAAFSGESALGTWTVEITDWFSADTGTLHEWGLMFTGIDNNPGDSLEQNDAFPQATDLGTIGVFNQTGLSIHKTSDVDFFRFNAQDSTHVQIDLTFAHSDGNLDFIVYDTNQQEMGRSDTINDDESMRVAVEAGELYFIQVLGTDGGTNTYDLSIDVPRLVAESGTIGAVDANWQWVPFSNQFDNPVILVSAPTLNAKTALTVDINEPTSDGFFVRLNSWEAEGPGAPENLNFYVVEAGTHTLRDGTVIVAGRNQISNGKFQNLDFGTTFETTPVVFGQIENSDDAVTMRLNSVDNTGASWKSQLRESDDPILNVSHTAHWLAVEPGTGSTEYGDFEAGVVALNSDLRKVGFSGSYGAGPHAIFSIQSFNESDSVGVRLFSTEPTHLKVFLQEERSADIETVHAAESVGYFVFGNGEFYAAEPQNRSLVAKTGGDEARMTGSEIELRSKIDDVGNKVVAFLPAKLGVEQTRRLGNVLNAEKAPKYDLALAGSIEQVQADTVRDRVFKSSDVNFESADEVVIEDAGHAFKGFRKLATVR